MEDILTGIHTEVSSLPPQQSVPSPSAASSQTTSSMGNNNNTSPIHQAVYSTLRTLSPSPASAAVVASHNTDPASERRLLNNVPEEDEDNSFVEVKHDEPVPQHNNNEKDGKEKKNEMTPEEIAKREEFQRRIRTLAATGLFFLLTGVLPSLVIYFEKDRIMSVIKFIQGAGFLGGLYYVIILIFWTIVCLPTTILELACGFIFGFKISVAISLLGKSTGSIFSYFLGNKLLRKNIQENLLTKYPVMKAIQAAIVDKPYTIIFLTRICVLPMAVKNYGVSILEGVPIIAFVVCVVAGGLPFTLAWSYFGSASSDVMSIAGGGSSGMSETQKAMKTAFLVIGIVASVVFLIVMKYFTQKQMKKFGLDLNEKPAEGNVLGSSEENDHQEVQMSEKDHSETLKDIELDSEKLQDAKDDRCSVEGQISHIEV